MASYNKLVRDGIPQIIRDKGGAPRFHQAKPEEFRFHLHRKLVEEVEELGKARGSQDRLEELADVLEVVQALAEFYGISLADLETTRAEKHQVRGGFDQGYILEEA